MNGDEARRIYGKLSALSIIGSYGGFAFGAAWVKARLTELGFRP